jgi:signal transduction histidine kinase
VSGERAASPRRSPGDEEARLLAEASHALRTPLGALRNWAQLLRSRLGDSPDPVVRRALDGIDLAVEQQVRVIEERLDRPAREGKR